MSAYRLFSCVIEQLIETDPLPSCGLLVAVERQPGVMGGYAVQPVQGGNAVAGVHPPPENRRETDASSPLRTVEEQLAKFGTRTRKGRPVQGGSG